MKLKKVNKYIWEIEKEGKMNVPITIFASEPILKKIMQDKTLEQAKNMAMMPGVVKGIIVLPDSHQGYGACIGGVAAYDLNSNKGVVSPGQIGYDINCGVRLLVSNLKTSEFMEKREDVINELFKNIPSGVGKGSGLRLTVAELDVFWRRGWRGLLKKDMLRSKILRE